MNLPSFIREKMPEGQKTAILGVGSVLRSDDGAGMHFIEMLSGFARRDDLLLISGSTAPENFTGVIRDFAPDRLFIVDAAFMGLPAGEIRVLAPDQIDGLPFSTHMLPLPVMLKYLRHDAGCEVIFIGIQPENTDFGCSMCESVLCSAERLAKLFRDALSG